MRTIIPRSFVEDLKDKGNIDDYLFKIEMAGVWFETQDVKTFQSCEYRKVNSLSQFAQWLQLQPLMMKRDGCCQEITEIWRIKKHYKRYENPLGNYEDSMVLVWSKKKGWIENVYADGIYKPEEGKE